MPCWRAPERARLAGPTPREPEAKPRAPKGSAVREMIRNESRSASNVRAAEAMPCKPARSRRDARDEARRARAALGVKARSGPASKTGFLGVRANSKGGFLAMVYVAGRAVYAGVARTAVEAARKYDTKAIELLGDRAKLNFDRPKESPCTSA